MIKINLSGIKIERRDNFFRWMVDNGIPGFYHVYGQHGELSMMAEMIEDWPDVFTFGNHSELHLRESDYTLLALRYDFLARK